MAQPDHLLRRVRGSLPDGTRAATVPDADAARGSTASLGCDPLSQCCGPAPRSLAAADERLTGEAMLRGYLTLVDSGVAIIRVRLCLKTSGSSFRTGYLCCARNPIVIWLVVCVFVAIRAGMGKH